MNLEPIDVAVIDNRYYVCIDDFALFLDESMDNVRWWCEDAAPEGTKYVVDTLQATKDFLMNLKGDNGE